MPTIYYTTDEEYPVYCVQEDPSGGLIAVDVEEADLEVVRAYVAAEEAYHEAKEALRKVLIPHCPVCGHPQHRHQEWSKGWDTWGCLDKENGKTCLCQYGLPEGR